MHASGQPAAAYCAPQFVLVMGTCVSAVCLVWFGLAGSIATAAASRIVAGLLNGILV